MAGPVLPDPAPGRRGAPGELLERVYEGDAEVDSNSVEVIITRLRRKIAPARIETVRGHGYRLTAGEAA